MNFLVVALLLFINSALCIHRSDALRPLGSSITALPYVRCGNRISIIPHGKSNFYSSSRVHSENRSAPSADSRSDDLRKVKVESATFVKSSKAYVKESWKYILVLKDDSKERSLLVGRLRDGLGVIWRSAVRSVREGELGSRGEQWFVLQALLVCSVLLGVPNAVSTLIHWSSSWCTLCGLGLATSGVWALRDSLSPFPAPVLEGKLVTSGIYQVRDRGTARNDAGLCCMVFGY